MSRNTLDSSADTDSDSDTDKTSDNRMHIARVSTLEKCVVYSFCCSVIHHHHHHRISRRRTWSYVQIVKLET